MVAAGLVARASLRVLPHPTMQRRQAAEKLTPAHGRVAEPLLPWRHVGYDAALRPNDRALADGYVVGKPHLSGQNDAILYDDAAGDPALRHDDAMAADRDIVSDLHQDVDLCASADHGIAVGPSVDGGPGPDLHLILHDDAANPQDLAVTGRSHDIAEAILSDGAAGVHDDAVPDQAVGNHGVGADNTLPADTDPGSDHRTGGDERTGPDLGLGSDHATGIDRYAALEACGRMDERPRRHGARGEQGGWAQRVRKQRPRDFHESTIRLANAEHADMRGRAAGIAWSGEAGTGVARRQLRHIFRFVEKGQVVGSSTVERRNSSDAAIEISAGSRGGAGKGGDLAHGEDRKSVV